MGGGPYESSIILLLIDQQNDILGDVNILIYANLFSLERPRENEFLDLS